MKLYSTNSPEYLVSFRQAILQSLPPDNGLYMPEYIPELAPQILENIEAYSFQELSYHIALAYLKDEVPTAVLQNIINEAINFPAPLITIDERISILELFHGPTQAFKDFGARFMARLMNFFWDHKEGKLTILVATSGDTGGAVAAGFHGLDNIEVVILYPKGKVSGLQQNQLTTWGDNIKALEVEGDFDDCQKMVKEAFLDQELNRFLNLSSANSINIARLIPQSFYYFEAIKQLPKNSKVSFCVPSGNFGNLTAGLFSKKMGLNINQMIAATNINDVVPQYLTTGVYEPQQALPTLSNAMDIGNPSNFSRILDLYGSTWNLIQKDIRGYSFDDKNTMAQILETQLNNAYVLDPHTAIGVLAAKQYIEESSQNDDHLIVLSTAHPIKFQTELSNKINFTIPHPASIHKFFNKESTKIPISADYNKFKNVLLDLGK